MSPRPLRGVPPPARQMNGSTRAPTVHDLGRFHVAVALVSGERRDEQPEVDRFWAALEPLANGAIFDATFDDCAVRGKVARTAMVGTRFVLIDRVDMPG